MSNKQQIVCLCVLFFFVEENEEEDDKEGFHFESNSLMFLALIAMTLTWLWKGGMSSKNEMKYLIAVID